MQYIDYYCSPLGEILLVADGAFLTGLWFADNGSYFGGALKEEHVEQDLPVFKTTRCWLDCYFSGEEPAFIPPIRLLGTAFQGEVWKILRDIPYGQTTTYGKIAARIAEERGISRMSAQAVGGAVGHNPISIIVPCHRVVGVCGKMVGYGGGIDRKIKLLELEHAVF